MSTCTRHPVRGALTGLIIGLAIGALSQDRLAGGTEIVLRYAAGAGLAGLIIGTLLPAFRSRMWASAIVATSVTLALIVAWGLNSLPLEAIGFLGGALGLLYGVLLWDYA